jgi:hypothetical protein
MFYRSSILISILAGIAAGLMIIAAFRAGSAVLLMLFAAPVAVYLASLGWGTLAGFLAALIASVVSGFAGGGAASTIITAALLFFPAAWAGHLANLGQSAPDGKSIIWYPPEAILTRLTIAIAGGFIVAGFVLGADSGSIETAIMEMLREMLQATGEQDQISDENLARNAQFYAALIPLVVPAVWLFMHVAIFYIASVIAHRSGKLARTRDDIPATANLPFNFIGLPLAGIAGMLVAPSPVYEIAAVLAGTGIAAFALVGLADLHFNSRGRSARGLLLFAAYFLLFIFSIPIVLFAITGAIRSWRMQSNISSPPPPNGSGHITN